MSYAPWSTPPIGIDARFYPPPAPAILTPTEAEIVARVRDGEELLVSDHYRRCFFPTETKYSGGSFVYRTRATTAHLQESGMVVFVPLDKPLARSGQKYPYATHRAVPTERGAA